MGRLINLLFNVTQPMVVRSIEKNGKKREIL